MKKKYKYLLFDMDGTTANTDRMMAESFWALYDKYGKQRKTEEECARFVGPALTITLPQEFPEVEYSKIRQEFIDVSTPLYDKVVEAYPYEVEAIKHLHQKGYKLAIVTNKNTDLAEHVLEILGIAQYFDVVIGSFEIHNFKPDPEGLFLAMERLGVKNKKDCLYIGDVDGDYYTSENAGIDCMLVSWGPRIRTTFDKCKYVVNSYEELEDVLSI